MKRRLVIVAGFAACITLAVCVAHVHVGLASFRFDHDAWGNQVTWNNFYKIKRGMPENDVEVILGQPFDILSANDVPPGVGGKAVRVARWFGRKGMIEVGMSEKSGVEWMRFTEGARNRNAEPLWRQRQMD
jgi:hypothetical protein